MLRSFNAAIISGRGHFKPFSPLIRLYSSESTAMFEKAVADLKKLRDGPDDDAKLQLYGLFKQASEGDVRGDRPKMLEFVARAKYDAWSKYKGTSNEEAQLQYAKLVNSLLQQAGINSSGSQQKAENSVSNENNDTVRVSKQDKIFKIELNRPDKYNALTWEMYEAIIKAMNDSNKCHDTSITVFTGVGDYYCSGNDLSNFMRIKTQEDMHAMAEKGEDVLERFVRAHIEHEKPLISLVNGPAIGISVTLMALYDLVYASDKATFHTPFSSLGQSPEGCSTYTFPLLMGTTKACEMLLFDKKLTAQEAMERNLVTQVFPNASFRAETDRLINRFSHLPPESLRVNKQLVRDVHKQALLEVCKHECKVLKSRWLSAECHEALMKFRNRKSKI